MCDLFTKDEGNYIHMLWQLLQYFCVITADAIFVVTTAEFAFNEVIFDYIIVITNNLTFLCKCIKYFNVLNTFSLYFQLNVNQT